MDTKAISIFVDIHDATDWNQYETQWLIRLQGQPVSICELKEAQMNEYFKISNFK